MLRNAPATAIGIISTLSLSGLTGILLPSSSSASHRRSGAGGVDGGLASSLSMFGYPFGVFGSVADAVCICLILYHTRVLERQWGTGRFLSLSLVCSALGTLTLFGSQRLGFIPVPSGRHASAISGSVIGTAWSPLVAALVLLYYKKIPALGQSKIIGNFVSVSEKSLCYGLAARYAAGVYTSVGPVVTAALFSVGSLVGYLSLHSNVSFISDSSAIVQLLSRIPGCGGTKQLRHARVAPPPADDDAMDGLDPDVRAALAAAGALDGAGAGGAMGGGGGGGPAPAASATASTLRNRNQSAAPAASAAPPQSLNVDPQAVEMIMGIGLGCTEQQAAEALHVCGGNVDAAVHFLMEKN